MFELYIFGVYTNKEYICIKPSPHDENGDRQNIDGLCVLTRQVGALRCAVQIVLYMANTYEVQVANITVT